MNSRQYQTNTSTSSKSQWNNAYLPNKSGLSSLKPQKRSTRDISARDSEPVISKASPKPVPKTTGMKLKLECLVTGMREREQLLDDLGELKARQVGESQLSTGEKDCVEFNSYPIPEEIMQRYKSLDSDSYVQKGLLPLINTSYFILHDCLLLWKVNNEANLYDSLSIQSDNICALQFDRQIQAVQLFPNQDKFYQHPYMLVLSFETDFAVYNISDQFDYALVQDQIYKGPMITNCIEVSEDARIFFGGNTDSVYEIECENRKYRVRNYRQALDRGLILNNLKNKIKDYHWLLKGKEVVQISIDNSRELVYALTKTASDLSSIQVYGMADSLTYLFQVTDRQIKEQINRYEQVREHVSVDYIVAVDHHESKNVGLVAVTGGLRVFLELTRSKELGGSRLAETVRGLKVAFVKPLGSENGGQCVYLGKWGRRWVAVSRGEQEALVCQMVSQQRGEREVSQRVEVPLEEEDIVMAQVQQGLDPGLASLLRHSQALGEQQFSGPFHLMVLTHRMLHLVIQPRQIDLLYSALLHQEYLTVHRLRQTHGVSSLCTMLLQMVIQEDGMYYQVDQNGQVTPTKPQPNVLTTAGHLFHFFSQQKNENTLPPTLQHPLLKHDEYGRALETSGQTVTVYLESVLTYYSRLTMLLRQEPLVNASVYNYQSQGSLSQLDNTQLGYVISRLQELADFLGKPRQTGVQSVCSMITSLLQYYPQQGQQGDLLEETKVLSELTGDLSVQVEWLRAMQLLNCHQLRLLIEQLNPVQIEMLLQHQYRHLLSQKPGGDSLLKSLLIHYLIIEPELFSEKRAVCRNTFCKIMTEQETEVAQGMLELKSIVSQQMEHSRLAKKREGLVGEEEVHLIQQRVLGMDNQSGVAVVAGAMESLREHCQVLDQYLLNDIFEQLDFLGGYVQFNQLVLAKLNSLQPQAALFQSLMEVVVALVQDDRHQVLHGLTPEQTLAIHQSVLQDIVTFDNKYLNREIISYLFSRQLYQEFVLFPVKDVDAFLTDNPSLLDQSSDKIDKSKFVYKYYLQKEEFNAAYELMIRLSHSASLQLQLRLFAFNCAQSALHNQAPDHRQLQVLEEQLRHLQVQDSLGSFVSQGYPEHPSLQALGYSMMSIQEMYDLAHDLEFHEGELMVYDLGNDIQEDVLRELYHKLFSSLLQQHSSSAETFVQECQQILLRLNSCLHDWRMLDCAIIVQELQAVNYLHPGFAKYLKSLNQPKKSAASPFWLFPFLREHLSNVNSKNILTIYIEMFNSVQRQILANQGLQQVVEIMYPINSLQAMLQTEIATVDHQLTTNFKQKALTSFIQQPAKINGIIATLQETLVQLQEQCVIDDELIKFSLKSNQDIASSLSRVLQKVKIVCKK